MKSAFRALGYLFIGLLGLIVFALVGYQLLQIMSDRQNAATVEGTVRDQDGQPLAGVEVTYRFWNWRSYVPIPFTSARTVEEERRGVTDPNGAFSIKGGFPRSNFVRATKPGYREDGREQGYMWQSLGSSSPAKWELHLVSESLLRREQLRAIEFSSVSFPPDGRLGLDLASGTPTNPPNADLVFRWQRLSATAQHGDYGKLSVYAPKGGVWFWEEERLFAPKENYEDGMVFFFDPASMNTYMKQRRAEFFVKSREGQIYARVFFQLDTGNSSLSLRARVNTSTNRFVDAKGAHYVIGIYSSLSPTHLSFGVPWWATMNPKRGQLIIGPQRIEDILQSQKKESFYERYFAAHYQTPTNILADMVASSGNLSSGLSKDLIKNVAIPADLLTSMKTKAGDWKNKEIDSTLGLPDDVKQFLLKPE